MTLPLLWDLSRQATCHAWQESCFTGVRGYMLLSSHETTRRLGSARLHSPSQGCLLLWGTQQTKSPKSRQSCALTAELAAIKHESSESAERMDLRPCWEACSLAHSYLEFQKPLNTNLLLRTGNSEGWCGSPGKRGCADVASWLLTDHRRRTGDVFDTSTENQESWSKKRKGES